MRKLRKVMNTALVVAVAVAVASPVAAYAADAPGQLESPEPPEVVEEEAGDETDDDDDDDLSAAVDINCTSSFIAGISFRLRRDGHVDANTGLDVHRNSCKEVTSGDFARDGISLGMQIDPSGPQAPILYVDREPNNGSALKHRFGYKVRKLRWAYVRSSGAGSFIPISTGEWRRHPLPHPDY